ncbi:MAG: hypothetical protein VW397_05445 [Candidatus Margulisiibacteriota bacterium]
MWLRGVLILIVSFKLNALNFYPLPNSFINNIWIKPFVSVNQYKNLDISTNGGAMNDAQNGLGVQLKFGLPFQGWGFQYLHTSSLISGGTSPTFTESSMVFDTFKLKYYYPLINDIDANMSLFFSLGQLSGHYKVITSTEGTGITNYIARNFNAYLIDLGMVFGYHFNPEWAIQLEAAYQYTIEFNLQNLGGETVNSPELNVSGALIQLGSSFRL